MQQQQQIQSQQVWHEEHVERITQSQEVLSSQNVSLQEKLDTLKAEKDQLVEQLGNSELAEDIQEQRLRYDEQFAAVKRSHEAEMHLLHEVQSELEAERVAHDAARGQVMLLSSASDRVRALEDQLHQAQMEKEQAEAARNEGEVEVSLATCKLALVQQHLEALQAEKEFSQAMKEQADVEAALATLQEQQVWQTEAQLLEVDSTKKQQSDIDNALGEPETTLRIDAMRAAMEAAQQEMAALSVALDCADKRHKSMVAELQQMNEDKQETLSEMIHANSHVSVCTRALCTSVPVLLLCLHWGLRLSCARGSNST